MKLYLYDIDKGFLYKLSRKNRIDRLLQLYPNWRDAEYEELEEVKDYFKKYGQIVASDAELTCRATY